MGRPRRRSSVSSSAPSSSVMHPTAVTVVVVVSAAVLVAGMMVLFSSSPIMGAAAAKTTHRATPSDRRHNIASSYEPENSFADFASAMGGSRSGRSTHSSTSHSRQTQPPKETYTAATSRRVQPQTSDDSGAEEYIADDARPPAQPRHQYGWEAHPYRAHMPATAAAAARAPAPAPVEEEAAEETATLNFDDPVFNDEDDSSNVDESGPISSTRIRSGGKKTVDMVHPLLPKRHVQVQAPHFSKLVFEDNFDELNMTRWEHEITAGGGGNWEFQYYTNNRSNTFVHDGVLYIKPTLTADRFGPDLLGATATLDLGGSQPPDLCTGPGFFGCLRMGGAGGNVINPIQSARIRTPYSFNFKYGRMEVRAKMPRGDWLWPAIWLMPRRNVYGDWPVSGEVDVAETKGNVQGGFSSQLGSTLHVGPYVQANDFWRYHNTIKLAKGDFADEFHVMGLVWTPDFFYTYLDRDDEAHRITTTKFEESVYSRAGWEKKQFDNPWRGRNYSAPFDQEFYIAMNVAVGGTNGYFADSMPGKPWTNADRNAITAFWNGRNQWLPTWVGDDVAMQVDWIRVWQETDEESRGKPVHERHTRTFA